MDEEAHYTTWQSCNLKVNCSLEAYTLMDSVPNPPDQMKTSIVCKNCVINLYGAINRMRLIEQVFIKVCKKEALVFHI